MYIMGRTSYISMGWLLLHSRPTRWVGFL